MATAATISIALEAQTAQLKQGFAETRQSIDKLQGGMSSAVAMGMAKFHIALMGIKAAAAAVKKTIEEVGQAMADMASTGDIADKIGIGAEALQALRYAAEQTGGSAGAMDQTLTKMTAKIADAAKNGGEMSKTLAGMGLNAQELAKLPVEQQVLAVADAIKGMNTVGEQNAALMKLMEEGGIQLSATFRGGSEALLELTEQARENGLSSDEMVRRAQIGQAAVLKLSAAWKAFKETLASFVVPIITAVVKGLNWIASGLAKLSRMTYGAMFGDDGGDPMGPLSDSAKRAVSDISSMTDATKDVKKAADGAFDKAAGSVERMKKTAADIRKELDAVKVTPTPAIAAVTRASAAGFSAVQQANRESQDSERRHREQLNVLYDIRRAIERGELVLAPVRI